MGWQADHDSRPGQAPGRGRRPPDLPAGFQHGGGWDAVPPSAALAAALEAAAGPDGLYDGAGIDALVGIARQWAAVESWAAAGLMGSLRAMMREDSEGSPLLRRRSDLPEGWDDSLNYEVAQALALGPVSAGNLAGLAWTLGVRLAGVGRLLADGTLTRAKAKLIAAVFDPLNDDEAARAEALILPEVAGKTYFQVERLAWRAAVAVAPDVAERRRRAAERERARVTVFREESGAVGLSGRDLPAAQALSGHASVVGRAREYEASGAFPGQTTSSLEALAYLHLLNGVSAADAIAFARAATAQPPDGGQDDAASGPGDDDSGDQEDDGPRNDGGRRGGPGGGADDPVAGGSDARGPVPGDDQDRGPGAPGGDDDSGAQRPDDDGQDTGGAGPGSGSACGGQGSGDDRRAGGGDLGPGDGGAPDGGAPDGEGLADDGPGGEDGGPGRSNSPGAVGGHVVVLPEVTVPLATLQRLAERAGDNRLLGPLDPVMARDIAEAAARSPDSRWEITVVDGHGYATRHGIARPRQTRRQDSRPPPGPASCALPARINITATEALLRQLAERAAQPRSGAPPGDWELRPRAPGDRDGAWTLTLPGGRELTVRFDVVPTHDCDHRHEVNRYEPGERLRRLVQVRDRECTLPTCSRPATDSDFEHAIPYDQGGRTCACNAGARSRRCHQVKQTPGWKVTQPKPGWHVWTTPTGRTYTQQPWRYIA
jgi:hypothetical protein